MATNETLASSCAIKIKELILNGYLLPGEQIKGEYLKSYLNVGLSPIREALSRLISTNLVEFIDHVGFRVTKLDKNMIYETYRSQAKLETLLLEDAINLGGDDWESSIISSLHLLSKNEIKGKKSLYKLWSDRNDDFHGSLIAASTLNSLKNVRDQLMLNKNWYYRLAYQKMDNELIEVNHSEHRQIAELVISRDLKQASTILYKHNMYNVELLIAKLASRGYLHAQT